MTWYAKVSTDLSEIPNFISHYDSELVSAKNDVKIFGNLKKNIYDLQGIN